MPQQFNPNASAASTSGLGRGQGSGPGYPTNQMQQLVPDEAQLLNVKAWKLHLQNQLDYLDRLEHQLPSSAPNGVVPSSTSTQLSSPSTLLDPASTRVRLYPTPISPHFPFRPLPIPPPTANEQALLNGLAAVGHFINAGGLATEGAAMNSLMNLVRTTVGSGRGGGGGGGGVHQAGRQIEWRPAVGSSRQQPQLSAGQLMQRSQQTYLPPAQTQPSAPQSMQRNHQQATNDNRSRSTAEQVQQQNRGHHSSSQPTRQSYSTQTASAPISQNVGRPANQQQATSSSSSRLAMPSLSTQTAPVDTSTWLQSRSAVFPISAQPSGSNASQVRITATGLAQTPIQATVSGSTTRSTPNATDQSKMAQAAPPAAYPPPYTSNSTAANSITPSRTFLDLPVWCRQLSHDMDNESFWTIVMLNLPLPDVQMVSPGMTPIMSYKCRVASMIYATRDSPEGMMLDWKKALLQIFQVCSAFGVDVPGFGFAPGETKVTAEAVQYDQQRLALAGRQARPGASQNEQQHQAISKSELSVRADKEKPTDVATQPLIPGLGTTKSITSSLIQAFGISQTPDRAARIAAKRQRREEQLARQNAGSPLVRSSINARPMVAPLPVTEARSPVAAAQGEAASAAETYTQVPLDRPGAQSSVNGTAATPSIKMPIVPIMAAATSVRVSTVTDMPSTSLKVAIPPIERLDVPVQLPTSAVEALPATIGKHFIPNSPRSEHFPPDEKIAPSANSSQFHMSAPLESTACGFSALHSASTLRKTAIDRVIVEIPLSPGMKRPREASMIQDDDSDFSPTSSRILKRPRVNYAQLDVPIPRFNKSSNVPGLNRDMLKRVILHPCKWGTCSALLASEWHLVKHMEVRKHVDEGILKEDGYQPIWGCLWLGCNQFFDSAPGLRSHVHSQHVAEMLRCPYEGCRKRTKQVSGMEGHIKLKHTEPSTRRLRPFADCSPPHPPSLPIPSIPPTIETYRLFTCVVFPGRWRTPAKRLRVINMVSDHSWSAMTPEMGEHNEPYNIATPLPNALTQSRVEEVVSLAPSPTPNALHGRSLFAKEEAESEFMDEITLSIPVSRDENSENNTDNDSTAKSTEVTRWKLRQRAEVDYRLRHTRDGKLGERSDNKHKYGKEDLVEVVIPMRRKFRKFHKGRES